MDEIALIADIHGNLPALEAVAADINARGISRIFCLGDMCGRGPKGSAVVDWCRANCEVIIQGNWEDFFIQEPYNRKAKNYIEELGPVQFDFIKTLPLSHKMWMSGRRIHLFHGRPLYAQIVFAEAPPEEKLELFSVLNDDTAPDVVCYADIHRQYKTDFQDDPRVLINTGSVGNSFCTPTACYTIMRGTDGAKEPAPFSFEFASVPYDHRPAAENARKEASWFDAEPYIKEITTGTWQDIK